MYDFLKKIPLFAGLPRNDLQNLCQVVEEVKLAAGEELFAEGSLGKQAYVIKEGELEVLKASSGRDVLLAVCGPGEVIGELALLEDKPRMATVRARSDSSLVVIHKEQLYHFLSTSPSAAYAMFLTLSSRWRTTEAMLRQSEKMAQLGTLTAGVAHELNNPAAAVRRSAGQLQAAVAQFRQAQAGVNRLAVTETQRAALAELAQRAQTQAVTPLEMDALLRSDRECELELWLETRGVRSAWELAPALVNLNCDTSELATLAAHFSPEQLAAVVDWLNATYTVHNLLAEVGQAAGRISQIVKALKSYSYMDQAPVQAVNLHEGLDDTLLILRHKLNGIIVRREYAPDLPKIQAYGSELNQVWTNLIDNAADALQGQGEIVLRTRQDREWVLVEIEDDGPGIPEEIQPRLFDPFFTTKPPGVGTGLGLGISYNIVVHKHRGDIQFTSQPGKTVFQVWLPVNFDAR